MSIFSAKRQLLKNKVTFSPSVASKIKDITEKIDEISTAEKEAVEAGRDPAYAYGRVLELMQDIESTIEQLNSGYITRRFNQKTLRNLHAVYKDFSKILHDYNQKFKLSPEICAADLYNGFDNSANKIRFNARAKSQLMALKGALKALNHTTSYDELQNIADGIEEVITSLNESMFSRWANKEQIADLRQLKDIILDRKEEYQADFEMQMRPTATRSMLTGLTEKAPTADYAQRQFGTPYTFDGLIDKHRAKRKTRFRQDEDFRNGLNWQGSCYGYVTEVVKYRCSNSGQLDELPRNLHLSVSVDRAQVHQRKRAVDHEQLVSRRLGRKYIETDLDKRADKLLEKVDRHLDTDIRLNIYGATGAHSLYIRKNNDGKIDFFDPNFGLFKFDNDDEFKVFYKDLHREYHAYGKDMPVYDIRALYPKDEAPAQGLLSQLAGKWRSLITGTKHSSWLVGGLLGSRFVAQAKSEYQKNADQVREEREDELERLRSDHPEPTPATDAVASIRLI